VASHLLFLTLFASLSVSLGSIKTVEWLPQSAAADDWWPNIYQNVQRAANFLSLLASQTKLNCVGNPQGTITPTFIFTPPPLSLFF
jgi:hypothetical protein